MVKTTKKRSTYPKVSQEIRYPETGDVALVPLNNRQRRLLNRQRREAGAPPLVEGEVIRGPLVLPQRNQQAVQNNRDFEQVRQTVNGYLRSVIDAPTDNLNAIIPQTAQNIINAYADLGYPLMMNETSLQALLRAYNGISQLFRTERADFDHIVEESNRIIVNLTEGQNLAAVGSQWTGLMSMIARYSENHTRLLEQARTTNQELQVQLRDAQERAGQAAGQARGYQEVANSSGERVRALNNDIVQLNNELNGARANYAQLVRFYNENHNELSNISADLLQTEMNRDQLRSELTNLQGNYRELEGQLQGAQYQIQQLQGDAREHERARDESLRRLNLVDQWQGSISDLIGYLTNHLVEAVNRSVEISNVANRLQTDLSNREDDIRALNARLVSQQEENNQQLSELRTNSTTRINELNSQLQNARQQAEALRGVQSQNAEELTRLRRQYMHEYNRANRNETNLHELTNLQIINRGLENDIADLERQAEAAQEQIAVHERRERELMEANSGLQAEVDSLNQLNRQNNVAHNVAAEAARELLEQVRGENAQNIAEVARLQQLLADARLANANMAEDNARLHGEVNEARAHLLNARNLVEGNLDNHIANMIVNAADAPEDNAQAIAEAHMEQVAPPFENQQQVLNQDLGANLNAFGAAPRGNRANGRPVGRPARVVNVQVRVANSNLASERPNKRTRNNTAGGYVVGGRPDPLISPQGPAFWRNVYKSRYHLF